MIGVDQGGGAAESIDLEKGWLRVMEEQGFNERVVDVGGPILSTVAILSAVEAARVNRVFKKRARAGLADSTEIGRHLNFAEVDCARRVDELLARIGEVAYFSPWVIVETANID